MFKFLMISILAQTKIDISSQTINFKIEFKNRQKWIAITFSSPPSCRIEVGRLSDFNILFITGFSVEFGEIFIEPFHGDNMFFKDSLHTIEKINIFMIGEKIKIIFGRFLIGFVIGLIFDEKEIIFEMC